jgi:hypothetical protein
VGAFHGAALFIFSQGDMDQGLYGGIEAFSTSEMQQ